MAKKKISAETTSEVVSDIEKSGVPDKVAEKSKEATSNELAKEALDENEQLPKNLKIEAEAESTKPNIEELKKKILEKAAKLKEKVSVTSTEELKEQIKAKKREDMLVPLEEYVKSGIYLGTKVVTPDMKPYVYRRRADGLAIFNTDLIDEKLKEAIGYLVKFEAKDIILVCKRQAGWRVAKMFADLTGIRVFTKKYPAGILTNTDLPDFFENALTIVTDHWLDKNALNDTLIVNKEVLMICDTNNFSHGANKIIIGNNKSSRSLGLIFYLLTQGYCKAKKLECNIPDLEWWTGDEEEGTEQKINRKVEFGV